MTTATAAVGLMEWDDDQKAYMFWWPVPESYKPNPLLVVEIDVFEGEECVAEHRCMRWLAGGQTFPVSYSGDDNEGGGDKDRDEPKPPGIALDFDPDKLLRAPVLVGA